MRTRRRGPEVPVQQTMPWALRFPGPAGGTRRVDVDVRPRGRGLAAVVTAFVGGLPGDGGKGALKEGVIDDVALVIFAFDDPVAGVGFALSGVGEDHGGVLALCCVY